jgi:hypothetical protein
MAKDQPTAKNSEWSISSFYSKAWDLTWKHKKLWILGFALMAFTSSGMRFNMPGGGSSSPSTKQEQTTSLNTIDRTPSSLRNTPQPNIPSQRKDVPAYPEMPTLSPDPIGNAPLEAFEKTPEAKLANSAFFDDIMRGFQSVSVGTYILLGLEIIVLIAGGFILGLVARAWALGSMIIGVAEADKKGSVGLFAISTKALQRVKSILWVTIVPPLLGGAILIGLVFVLIVLSAISAAIFPLLAIVFPLIFIVLVVWGAIVLSASSIWAVRYATLQELSGSIAFRKGYEATKGNIRKMVSLGFMNWLISLGIMIALIIPAVIVGFIAVAIGMAAFKAGVFVFVPLLVIASLVALFVIVPVFSLASSMMYVFKYATWHYGFEYITSGEKKS